MIRIGCTTFSEHGSIVHRKASKLFEYASVFPVVELDTSYHYLPKEKDVRNWLTQVPDNFRFILKVHQSVTTQGDLPEGMTMPEAVVAFKQAIQPLVDEGKLYCLLAQFPNRFKCTKESVAYLDEVRQWFADYPVAIELRDNSWYQPEFHDSMQKYMSKQKFSLVIVDEPKKLSTTVPLEPTVTNSAFAVCRFHGRNDIGWTATGPDAQKKRTFYHYSDKELAELQQAVEEVATKAQEIAVIFNNNAGGDAAGNAQSLIETMKIDYHELNPSQLELF
jgi:uncharacterized protein YecE (DUF72 family)